MYINFWYPICTSEQLNGNEPVAAQVLGLPFVAFRDEAGAPHVLANTCVHRGGSLAKGWVKESKKKGKTYTAIQRIVSIAATSAE